MQNTLNIENTETDICMNCLQFYKKQSSNNVYFSCPENLKKR